MRFSDLNFVCTSYFCHVLKCVLQDAMAPSKKVCKGVPMKTKQLHISRLFAKPSLSTMFSALFDHPDSFSKEH